MRHALNNRISVKYAWISLLALSALTASTFNAAQAEPNWVLIGEDGRTSRSLDLNSYRQLPSGISTYTIKTQTVNPYGGSIFEYENSDWGIDCKTKENIFLKTGKRSPLTGNKSVPKKYRRGSVSEELEKCPGSDCLPSVFAYQNFCKLGN